MNYLLGISPDPLFSLHGMKHNVYQGLHEIKKCVHILYVIQLVNHNIIVLGGLIDCSEMKDNFWLIKQWLEIIFHFRTVYMLIEPKLTRIQAK